MAATGLIPWAPRLLLTERTFRLPVVSGAAPHLRLDGFVELDRRWSARDGAWFFYLRSPGVGGDYSIEARCAEGHQAVTIQVRRFAELRRPFEFNGHLWPRRWPPGRDWQSAKRRQTLQHEPLGRVDDAVLRWWTAQDDATLWRQLPSAEFPRAHYVNVHQGCPGCGTAIFAHHGFYPWKRHHQPWDLRCECPACGAVFPSNDLAAGDFHSGDFVDDGFGFFDADNHVFLFAASSHRELVSLYLAPMRTLTAHLRGSGFDAAVARQLGLLLLRWSVEEVYVAAAPQFRHGPSQEVEKAWDFGQPDWAVAEEPIAALYRKGSLAYAIDVPVVAEVMALAYDTVWPFLRDDGEIVARAGALGLALDGPQDAVSLIEECLCCLMQCAMDGAALSNKPRTSTGVLDVLRALDRADAQEVMEWLYDRGPDRLRVFVTNNFAPDGMPPEANGGYNNTHTAGVFVLEHGVRQLRALHPQAYPEEAFPSITDDPRLERLVRAPYDIALLGKIPFHCGDGGSAGVQSALANSRYEPLDRTTLERVAEYVGGVDIAAWCDDALAGEPRRLGTTVHDGAGFAILRTGECPERAAAGIVYGDAVWHRHQDLLDVQLYAFGRPFLSDLGYPQSWAHVGSWEGNWATHNTVWAVVPQFEPLALPFDTPWHFLKEIAGRGRLLRLLQGEGVQLVEIEARRWVFDVESMSWVDPGVTYRRLLGLIETGGDGVALVDLARVRGGCEHWRICRGMEGSFALDGVGLQSRPGTLAGPEVVRGREEEVAHADYRGLAWMDEVAAVDGRVDRWRGGWNLHSEEEAYLDLHQLRISPGTQVFTARATAVMGAPEASKYQYYPVAWRRTPGAGEVTCVDLVFEPRIGAPTLAAAGFIAATADDTAAGVTLDLRSGRRLAVYWAPQAVPDRETEFTDGTVLRGALAIVADGRATGAARGPDATGALPVSGPALARSRRVVASGVEELRHDGVSYRLDTSRQAGVIEALDRRACTIEVSGLVRVAVGERLCINPEGRGHSYRVEAVDEMRSGRLRLRLDMASVLGRARIAGIDGRVLELDFFLIARTANLHQTRLQREVDGSWEIIAAAANRDAYSTTVHLTRPLAGAAVGQWVAAVDYVVGDPVSLEAMRSPTTAENMI